MASTVAALPSYGRDIETLKKQYIGTSLLNAAVPSAVLDLVKVKRNCERMLEAVDQIGCGWRAHIKTHKVDCLLPNTSPNSDAD